MKDSNLTKISINQLRKFRNLKMLDISNHRLDSESIVSLTTYKAENPDVIVIQNRSNHIMEAEHVNA